MHEIRTVFEVIEDDDEFYGGASGPKTVGFFLDKSEAEKTVGPYIPGPRYRHVKTHTGIMVATGEVYLLADPKPVLKLEPKKEAKDAG